MFRFVDAILQTVDFPFLKLEEMFEGMMKIARRHSRRVPCGIQPSSRSTVEIY